jgi:hypothetical protein
MKVTNEIQARKEVETMASKLLERIFGAQNMHMTEFMANFMNKLF